MTSKLEQQIKNDLDNGLIKYKKNSKSIEYKYFDNLDKNADGTIKEYFEFSDLMLDNEINKYIFCYIINSKKGIGKTYQLKKLMLEAYNEGKYTVFIRRIKEDFDRLKYDWKIDNEWPFYIKGYGIFSKKDGKLAGRIATISTIYSETGQEFPNFKYIIFDEFKDKRGISRYIDGEFGKFVKFCADVQRNKPDLKIFMCANDETKYDPYTIGLRIDATTDYFIDPLTGVFYVNLTNKFIGAIKETTTASRLSIYDNQLQDQFKNNATTYNDDSNMIDISKSNIDDIKFYFYLNKRLYAYGFNNENNILIIKSIYDEPSNTKIIYSLTSNDYMSFKKTTRPHNIYNFSKTLYNLLYRKKICFCNYEDKMEVINYIERIVGKFKLSGH